MINPAWQKVGGSWSESGGLMTGYWSLSAAQTDQGNLLLGPSVSLPDEYYAEFTYSRQSSGNPKFVAYNSAGNVLHFVFGGNGDGFKISRRVNSANYVNVVDNMEFPDSISISCDPCVAGLHYKNSVFTMSVRDDYGVKYDLVSFTDKLWNGFHKLGLSVYGTVEYDSFSLSEIQPLNYALESPSQGDLKSGVGLIRGWVCDANKVEISIDNGDLKPAIYGNIRRDTKTVCGDIDNGFELLWLWSLLDDGNHTIRVYVDDALKSTATFEVGTLGYESGYVRGLSGVYTLQNFPVAGETTTIEWSEKDQNFLISGSTYSESEFSPIGTWVGPTSISGEGESCSYSTTVNINGNGTGTIINSLLSDNSPSLNCVSGSGTFNWSISGYWLTLTITSTTDPIIGGGTTFKVWIEDVDDKAILNHTNMWYSVEIVRQGVLYRQ